MASANLRKSIYGFAFLNAVIIIACWVVITVLPALNTTDRLIALGRLTGLIAAFCALIEVFLMSRLASIEKAFGLEQLIKIHRWNGYAVFYSLLLHPIFLVYGYQIHGKPDPFSQFFNFILHYPDMVKALIGSVLFLGVAGLSISYARKRIGYEFWYVVHITAYLAIVLAFFHQITTGGDFLGHKLFTLYWVALIIGTFALVAVYRIFSPYLIWLETRARVDRVTPESDGVFSVYISGRNFNALDIQAGQYFGFQFLDRSLWAQTHPFTISKSARNNELRITFKVYGGYTSNLSNVKTGTIVLLDGPRGNLTWNRSRLQKTLMIAGGIGITPLRALIEAAPSRQDIVMIYSVRDRKSAPLLDEFSEIITAGKHAVFPILTKESGRITSRFIVNTVPDIVDREVYICGPNRMVDELMKDFHKLGISKEDIHVEKFNY